ncbi:hypothetical protein QBC35DRAFT_12146 [Podospora australis]|uniref:Uncharacterized protein n=1 Tax=Podospora australis TaxID=1536484 RepID=A0AAN6X188_9PEZI|nr:hypothetical protein QBC35DRAFT_12146 [Podospora australis]
MVPVTQSLGLLINLLWDHGIATFSYKSGPLQSRSCFGMSRAHLRNQTIQCDIEPGSLRGTNHALQHSVVLLRAFCSRLLLIVFGDNNCCGEGPVRCLRQVQQLAFQEGCGMDDLSDFPSPTLSPLSPTISYDAPSTAEMGRRGARGISHWHRARGGQHSSQSAILLHVYPRRSLPDQVGQASTINFQFADFDRTSPFVLERGDAPAKHAASNRHSG